MTLRGGLVTAQADIRPSRGWMQGSASGAVYVRLGGDAHLMGNINNTDANYLYNIACGFGFKSVGNGASGNSKFHHCTCLHLAAKVSVWVSNQIE